MSTNAVQRSVAQRSIYGAGNLGTAQRGRTPTSRLDYDSTAAKLFGTTKHSFQFDDQAQQAEFQRLIGDRDIGAGEYYGDYAVVESGSEHALPGYERVGGYMARRALTPVFTEQAYRDKESPNFSEDLQVLRRRAEAPAPAPTGTPAPAPTPTPPAPHIDASNPSLANALSDQRAARDQRPALQGALDSALEINRWKDAGSGTAAERPGSDAKADSTDSSGRRFAASDRWRQRLEEVSSRFA